MAEFRIDCFHNEFLAAGGTVMNAVVTVAATDTGSGSVAGVGAPSAGAPGEGLDVAAPTGSDRAELIIVDASGSMAGRRLREVKAATATAIDCLPDGVRFGVISGNHVARVAFPAEPPLAVSSPSTRKDAKEVTGRFEAGGGTAMGSWIQLAAQVLRAERGIKHAILLTDGRNESEDPSVLDAVLDGTEGEFQCDCRGVGADWEVADLRRIATHLMGTYDIVADPAGLAADFASMMKQSLGRQVADVTLRVWNPQGAQLTVFKQMEPLLIDLTSTRTDTGPQTGEYATGSWGDESRDYYLSVRVPPGEVDDEMLAARVTLLVGGEAAGQALVTAIWTEDTAKSTKINRRVAEALGETELADVIQQGIDAHRAGDIASATDRFGQAVRLATETGNADAVGRLARVVDIDDPTTGRVRPKQKVDDVDVMIIETRSTRMTRTKR